MSAEDWLPGDDPYNNEQEEDHVIKYDELRVETEKAYLLETRRGMLWVPKSQTVLDQANNTAQIAGWMSLNYFEDEFKQRKSK